MKEKLFESHFGERYRMAILENGLRIYVCEKPEYSSSYAVFGTCYGSIDTAFSADGGETVRVPEGIAHFLEHKLFESEDGDAFTRFAKTGANANAFTSFDRTCYLFSCSDSFEENLEILLDFVTHPYFTEQTVQKEQGIIGQEIRMYDDSPGWCVLFRMLSAMYHHHPVKIDIAGTTDSIAEITADLLYRCYRTFYNPANMFLCVAGNVRFEQVIRAAEKATASIPSVHIRREAVAEPESVIAHTTEREFDVSIPQFCLGFKEPCDESGKSLARRIHMSAALQILVGDCSPLYRRLISEELINDEFDSEYFTGRGYAAVLFSGESACPERVQERILEETERILKKGAESELLETVRRAMYGDSIKRYNSVENIVMQMCECAVDQEELFDEQTIIEQMTPQDILSCLSVIRSETAVLSVIKPRSRKGENA